MKQSWCLATGERWELGCQSQAAGRLREQRASNGAWYLDDASGRCLAALGWSGMGAPQQRLEERPGGRPARTRRAAASSVQHGPGAATGWWHGLECRRNQLATTAASCQRGGRIIMRPLRPDVVVTLHTMPHGAAQHLSLGATPGERPPHPHLPPSRTPRSMVPHKTPRGAAALERLKCFEGVPHPYDKVKRLVVPAALKVLRLQHGHRYCKVGDLSAQVRGDGSRGGRKGELRRCMAHVQVAPRAQRMHACMRTSACARLGMLVLPHHHVLMS